MKTLRERFIQALEANGEKRVKDTHKFVVYTRTIEGIQRGNYYIGRSGSLRVGLTSASSIPVSNKGKALLLEIEGTI